MRPRWSWQSVVRCAGLATAYATMGWLSLLLRTPTDYAAAVWPPAGLALGAALVWGRGAIAGTGLGAFLLNLGIALFGPAHSPMGSAIGMALVIAGGAAAQAEFGRRLLQGRTAGPTALDSEREVLRFLTLGGLLACVTSPTLGVLGLWSFERLHGFELTFSWTTWWVGDTIGTYTTAPLFLLFFGQPRQLWRQRLVPVGGPLVGALALGIVTFAFARDDELELLRNDFERLATDTKVAVQAQLGNHLDLLLSVASLFEASKEVERAEFETFVNGIRQGHDGIVAIEWLLHVPAEQLASYEAQQRLAGLPEFAVFERAANGAELRVASRPAYYPITYAMPLAGNNRVLGFDVASDPERRAALDRARGPGTEPAATGPVPLLQVEGRPGLVFARRLSRLGDPAKGIGPLDGFVAIASSIDETLGPAITRVDGREVQMRILDETAGDALVFARADPPDPLTVFPKTERLSFAGRTWQLEFAATRAFLQARRPLQAWAILVGGLLFAGLLGLVLLLLTGRTSAVQQLVQERTAELQQAIGQLALSVQQHRAAEAALQRSRMELELAQEQVGMGTWSFQPATGQRAWTAEMYKLFQVTGIGAPPTLPQFLELLHPDDREQVVANLQQVQQRTDSITHELRTNPARGPVRTLIASLRTIGEQAGSQTIVGCVIDITERRRDEERLRASLREKESMLKEIHHRVKNNLQIVSSLFSLQAKQTRHPEVVAQLMQSQNRVRSMAAIHEALYRSKSLDQIELRTHVPDLCNQIVRAYSMQDRIVVKTEVDALAFGLDRAVPFGLLLNELVTNALKHAFPGGRRGAITVSVRHASGERCVLSVGDDGVGLPPEVDPLQSSSLGLQLVVALARQLGGQLAVFREHGTRFEVVCDTADETVRAPSPP